MAFASSSTGHLPLPTPSTKRSLLAPCAAHRTPDAATVVELPHQKQPSNFTANLRTTLSNLLRLHLTPKPESSLENLAIALTADRRSPTESPKEDVSPLCSELHGSSDWSHLLNPLHRWLRREIVKYGEFSQAIYDAFDFNPFSEYCGSCLYNRRRLFDNLGLAKNGYNVTKYIYAMSHIELPRWLERSIRADTWSEDSNWMGYVAVSDDTESRRIGCRDIVVAWRGTIAPAEWFENLQGKLEPLGSDHGDVKVEHGFLSIYTSKSDATRYNKSSASEQVMEEIKHLVSFYRERGEQVSLTVTGHSLGGALALLNANEAASAIPDLPVRVVSFGAPRVGNIAFGEKLEEMKVKILRVVVKQDVVPKMPGIRFNEGIKKFENVTGTLDWVYTHFGLELELDVRSSPYLKRGLDVGGFHNLESYLHLVDGYLSSDTEFRLDARRDVALVNKASGILREELRIPPCWYQSANKGLVCNSYGRRVQPQRDPEDIPSPDRTGPMTCHN
ncbi:phospholipase A1-Igamma1, chloroplastic-like [Cocos nucifera]|uniref:Phospholipase A1-Igamma1, chloroplastic-like n=1 Tax=Cocos nucifera TaxID=13894 RepID=A0A8K0N4A0_COCNU|nr:phospholipase A1-Igamma1, chloroplastic-like [Cocos nucifera]